MTFPYTYARSYPHLAPSIAISPYDILHNTAPPHYSNRMCGASLAWPRVLHQSHGTGLVRYRPRQATLPISSPRKEVRANWPLVSLVPLFFCHQELGLRRTFPCRLRESEMAGAVVAPAVRGVSGELSRASEGRGCASRLLTKLAV